MADRLARRAGLSRRHRQDRAAAPAHADPRPRRLVPHPHAGAWRPGIVANTIFKDHWARPRPIDVTYFDGNDLFRPWWDPRGTCPNNCSFIAGEPSGAFWTLAPAALAPPQWRPLAYGAAIAFGAFIGVLRMSSGGHFFTDVVFAGVFTFLVVWTMHGLIYRWRGRASPTRRSSAHWRRSGRRYAPPSQNSCGAAINIHNVIPAERSESRDQVSRPGD